MKFSACGVGDVCPTEEIREPLFEMTLVFDDLFDKTKCFVSTKGYTWKDLCRYVPKTFSYEDDEGDMIAFNSDEEWQEAKEFAIRNGRRICLWVELEKKFSGQHMQEVPEKKCSEPLKVPEEKNSGPPTVPENGGKIFSLTDEVQDEAKEKAGCSHDSNSSSNNLEPPAWFIEFMKQYKIDLVEELSAVGQNVIKAMALGNCKSHSLRPQQDMSVNFGTSHSPRPQQDMVPVDDGISLSESQEDPDATERKIVDEFERFLKEPENDGHQKLPVQCNSELASSEMSHQSTSSSSPSTSSSCPCFSETSQVSAVNLKFERRPQDSLNDIMRQIWDVDAVDKEIRDEARRVQKMKAGIANMRQREVERTWNPFVQSEQRFKRRQSNSLVKASMDAEFVFDETVPDSTKFTPGTIFVKTWRVMNTGLNKWDSDTKLKHLWSNKGFTPKETIVPVRPLAPGEMGSVSVACDAPFQLGHYESHWNFEHQDHLFGHRIWCVIEVVAPTPLDCVDSLNLTEFHLPHSPSQTPLPALFSPLPSVEDQEDHNVEGNCEVSVSHASDSIASDKLEKNSNSDSDDDFDIGPSCRGSITGSDLASVLSLSDEENGDGFILVPMPSCFTIPVDPNQGEVAAMDIRPAVVKGACSTSSSVVYIASDGEQSARGSVSNESESPVKTTSESCVVDIFSELTTTFEAPLNNLSGGQDEKPIPHDSAKTLDKLSPPCKPISEEFRMTSPRFSAETGETTSAECSELFRYHGVCDNLRYEKEHWPFGMTDCGRLIYRPLGNGLRRESKSSTDHDCGQDMIDNDKPDDNQDSRDRMVNVLPESLVSVAASVFNSAKSAITAFHNASEIAAGGNCELTDPEKSQHEPQHFCDDPLQKPPRPQSCQPTSCTSPTESEKSQHELQHFCDDPLQKPPCPQSRQPTSCTSPTESEKSQHEPQHFYDDPLQKPPCPQSRQPASCTNPTVSEQCLNELLRRYDDLINKTPQLRQATSCTNPFEHHQLLPNAFPSTKEVSIESILKVVRDVGVFITIETLQPFLLKHNGDVNKIFPDVLAKFMDNGWAIRRHLS